jgi:hypothetical protein
VRRQLEKVNNDLSFVNPDACKIAYNTLMVSLLFTHHASLITHHLMPPSCRDSAASGPQTVGTREAPADKKIFNGGGG